MSICSRSLLLLLPLPLLAGPTFHEALSQGSVEGDIQLFHYDIDKDSGDDAYATALGGHLQYTTQTYKELYAQIAFHTSNPVGSQDNKTATGLFNNDKGGKALTALSSSFIGYRRNSRVLKLGNFRLNTPMMNDDTTRIVPWSYQGVAFTSTPRSGLRVQLNHITRIRKNTSDAYEKESASGAFEQGITMLGLHYDPYDELSFYSFYYHAPGLYDTFIAQADFKHPMDDDYFFCMGAQYFNSGNGGKYAVRESRDGGDDIDLVALRTSFETEQWQIGLNYSQNFGVSGIVKGYGGLSKVYTSSMIANGRGNYRPETWMLKSRYDLPVTTFGQSELAITLTRTRVKDARGDDFDAYYGHLRHYFDVDTSLYIRYEHIDYLDDKSDAGYLRIIASYDL